jgi:aryl-alcohol dehydrogenase-like predicted oxidoreductase
VAAIQVEYSLLQRTAEGELFGIARELGLGVEPWSPLAGGVLSGKYSRDNTSPAGSGRARSAAPRLTDKTFGLLDALRRIAGELGAPVAAVALAWVRQQAGVTSTIIGARTIEQLESNLNSLEVTIPDQQLAELDKLTEPQLDFPADILTAMVIPFQQAGATINDVASTGPGWMP